MALLSTSRPRQLHRSKSQSIQSKARHHSRSITSYCYEYRNVIRQRKVARPSRPLADRNFQNESSSPLVKEIFRAPQSYWNELSIRFATVLREGVFDHHDESTFRFEICNQEHDE